jgi:hypothetical protein
VRHNGEADMEQGFRSRLRMDSRQPGRRFAATEPDPPSADKAVEFDCAKASCSTSEKVYPGSTAFFFGNCNGATPASQVCTGSHVSTVCRDDAPTKAGQTTCKCHNPLTYENVITAIATVTCRQSN